MSETTRWEDFCWNARAYAYGWRGPGLYLRRLFCRVFGHDEWTDYSDDTPVDRGCSRCDYSWHWSDLAGSGDERKSK